MRRLLGLCLCLLPGVVRADDVPPGPPLLVIRELDERRAAMVREVLEESFVAAGFRIAVLTTDLVDPPAFERWLATTAEGGAFDSARIVVLGFSAAGVEAARLAYRHPTRVGALVLPAALQPIPTGVDPKAIAPDLPVYLTYGEADTTAPARIGEGARTALEAAGVLVQLDRLPQGDHFGVLRQGAAPMAGWSAIAVACGPRFRQATALVAAGKRAPARELLLELARRHPETRWAEVAARRAAALE